MLKETCANMDAQMEERVKARNEENEACSKALAVLSGDGAHDTFTRTLGLGAARCHVGSPSLRQKAPGCKYERPRGPGSK